MNTVPDRKRMRREYLKQKARIYAGVAVTTAVFLSLGLSTLHGWASWILLGIGCMAAGPLILQGMRFEMQMAAKIPYVPPVAPDALPAEEVLVRGAGAPAATNEILLRPADATQETKEEMLRPSQE